MKRAYIPEKAPIGMWRDIPNTKGSYQISIEGNVRRVCKSGKVVDIDHYKKASDKGKKIMRDRHLVRLTVDGKRKEYTVLRLMVMTYYGQPPKGMVAYHKNGEVTDDHLLNIGFITRKELAKKTAHKASAMAVFKIDQNGREIEIYRSARECAKKNFVSYQTVLDRCHGKVKNEYALDGTTYRFAKDIETDEFRGGHLVKYERTGKRGRPRKVVV